MKNKNTSILTFKNILKWILSIVAVLAGIFLFVFVYYAFSAPAVSQENLQSGGSSTIVDSTGKQIASLGDNKRNYVTIDKVPQQMEDAVVSIEDKNFYNEPLGIDPVRIAKSAFNNVTKGTLQGGSTLTQQLVKLTVFSTETKDQTFKRKMQEAWLAMRVSQKFSKQQILEFYMNKVYLNNGIYGVETGAKYYYGKNLKQLSLPQMALLAGLPNAPSNYDPYTHPTEAKQRRDLVIQAMYNNNKITKAQADEAMNTPITSGLQPYKKVSNSNNSKRIVADPYIKEAITEVKKKGFDPYRDNLKITVNMDYDAQKRLYNIVNSSNYVSFPDSKMQVGATVVNPNNGKVVAMIGGRNLGNVQFGLNRAVQTGRSNGSTMKPLLDYAPAIENLNWSTYHQLEDTEYTYAGTNIQLKDWDEQYEGQMSMRKALVNSRNIPAVRALSAVGLSNAKSFVKKLGITVKDKGLSVGIGGNVSSLQGAAAYSAFSNGGTYYKPYYVSKIETADGITHTYGKNGKQAMKDSTAYMITDMLKGVPSSYATYANISGLHQAGKTGTTNYDSNSIAQNSALSGTARDSWYNGYTKNYSISVWTGYDSPNQNGISSTYQSVAGKIYKAEMSYLAENTNSNPNWKKPSSVVSMRIQNSGSETPIVASPSSSSSSYTKELFVKGHAPSNPYKDSDYSSSSASKSSSNEVTTNNHSSSSSESTDSDNDTTDKDNTETGTGTSSDSNSSDSDNTTTNNSSDSSTTNNNSNTGNTNSNNSNNTNTGNSNNSNSGGTSTNNNSGSDSNNSSNTGDSNSGGTTNSNTGGSTNSGATTNGSSTDSSN